MRIVNYKESQDTIKYILDRSIDSDPKIVDIVRDVVHNVRTNGDKAVFEYTEKFDGYKKDDFSMVVDTEFFKKCRKEVDEDLMAIIMESAENIKKYHEFQKEKSWSEDFGDNVQLGQKITPLERVGVYVPGGKAFYPSSLLMNVMPAMVAGVEEIVVVSPPRGFLETPMIGAILFELGIEKAYLVGGAQAVAALAHGTETIPKVDKIVGPGNIFVATAKREVFGFVDIDMIAGPSEVVVLAESKVANPLWTALDILSQSEHRTGYESSVLICDSVEFAEEVNKHITEQLKEVDYADKVEEILEKFGAAIIVDDMNEGIDVVNRIAPEHLEILVTDEDATIEKIKHAGAIFVGNYSSEPIGDYWAGPNHVLPTSGTARFFSPLGTYDFVKKSSVIRYSKEAILKHGKKIDTFAKSEDLYFHGKAVLQRYNDLQE